MATGIAAQDSISGKDAYSTLKQTGSMSKQSNPTQTSSETVVAGDVGGTKVNLGVFSQAHGRPVPLHAGTFSSRDYAGFEEILDQFLKTTGTTSAKCCVGVAGPVVNGRCFTTNLPWVVSEQEIRTRFGFHSVELVNDLVATAEAVPILEETDVHELNAGLQHRNQNIGLIAAGTGLGEAFLLWSGDRHVAQASEGGHADFAPTNPLQIELWHELRKKFTHVSIERVLSGPGLYNVYKFFRDTGKATERKSVTLRLQERDTAQAISELAMEKGCPLCEMALDLFTHVYGSEAGNLALRCFTLGGIYLGGGIAPKILKKLKEPTFMKAFVAKGRLSSLLSQIPVKVILNDKAALLGAARRALSS